MIRIQTLTAGCTLVKIESRGSKKAGIQNMDNQKDAYFLQILEQVSRETRFLSSREFIQHGRTSVYAHSVQVAYESYRFARDRELKVNMEQLIRGALLHDYFLYDWHKQLTPHRLHGFFHPGVALRNACRDANLSDVEKDIIKKHMFPLTVVPPRYLESWIVCWIDKKCSMRETLKRRSYCVVAAGVSGTQNGTEGWINSMR